MNKVANKPNPATGVCTRCQKTTTNKCTGCASAPVYSERFLHPSFYCSTGCQKADWRQHKAECRKLNTRKTLARAASLLQDIIYRIRRHASPFQFKTARKQGSVIYLEEFVPGGLNIQPLRPLPNCFGNDRSSFEAISVYMGCMEAMLYLHLFTKELLDGLCFRIEEVNASVINQKLRISPITSDGPNFTLPGPVFHNLYRVTLKNGEIWAIDTTGAQFGYANPLRPWKEFEQERVKSINRECNFGHIRYQTYQTYGQFPMRYMVAQKVAKQELAQEIEGKIPLWAQEYGGKFNHILKGSDTTFNQAKLRFLDQLEDHVKQAVTRLNTPEQISRRGKEVEQQLAGNMEDTEKQEKLKGFVKFMASAIGAGSNTDPDELLNVLKAL